MFWVKNNSVSVGFKPMSDSQQHLKPLGPQIDLGIDTDNHTCKPKDCDKSWDISVLLYLSGTLWVD